MYFLHTNRAGSGNIFNGKLYTGAAEGERKGVKVQENSSSVTNLRWFWKRERHFFFFFFLSGWKTRLRRFLPPNKNSADLSESLSRSTSGQRKTTSPFQTWNSSPGRNIRNGTPLKCEAKQDATRRQMIGCQRLSKTRWSSHGARRLALSLSRVPPEGCESSLYKARGKEKGAGVKRRSLRSSFHWGERSMETRAAHMTNYKAPLQAYSWRP